MIYCDIGPRGSGKSTRILKEALEKGYHIATHGTVSVLHYKCLALDLGVDPEKIRTGILGDLYIRDVHIAPLSYWLDTQSRGNRTKILVDDLTLCLNRVLGDNFAGYSDTLEQGE